MAPDSASPSFKRSFVIMGVTSQWNPPALKAQLSKSLSPSYPLPGSPRSVGEFLQITHMTLTLAHFVRDTVSRTMGDFLKKDVKTPFQGRYCAAGVPLQIETNCQSIPTIAQQNLEPWNPRAGSDAVRL